jgi:hypothetical protein
LEKKKTTTTMKTKKPKTKLAKFLGEEKLYTFNNKP